MNGELYPGEFEAMERQGRLDAVIPEQKMMTRFEEAAQSPMNMAICVSFCIAGYLEQSGIHEFSDDELKKFMSEISTDIEEWLEEESEGQA